MGLKDNSFKLESAFAEVNYNPNTLARSKLVIILPLSLKATNYTKRVLPKANFILNYFVSFV